MNFIWLGISVIGLYFLSKYEEKIGGNLFYFLLMVILFIIGIIFWNILGFDSGSGGSPYGEPDMYFDN